MKKSIIFSAAIIILGALIAFGPQFLFPVCKLGMSATAAATAATTAATVSVTATDIIVESAEDGELIASTRDEDHAADLAAETAAVAEAAVIVDDCCAEPEESGCCGTSASSYPVCHWSARAELGLGFLIIALGLCMLVFCDPKTQLGLAIGAFFAGFIAIGIPNTLIGGCDSLEMTCHKTAFPALTAIGIVLLVCSAAFVVVLELGNKKSK